MFVIAESVNIVIQPGEEYNLYQVQPDQINWQCFSGTLKTCQVHYFIAYTGQVTFYKVTKHSTMYCITLFIKQFELNFMANNLILQSDMKNSYLYSRALLNNIVIDIKSIFNKSFTLYRIRFSHFFC